MKVLRTMKDNELRKYCVFSAKRYNVWFRKPLLWPNNESLGKDNTEKEWEKGKERKQTLIGLERNSYGTGFSSCSNYNKLSSLFLDSICWFLASVCYIVVIVIVIWIWIGSILNKNKGIYTYLWDAGISFVIRRATFFENKMMKSSLWKWCRIHHHHHSTCWVICLSSKLRENWRVHKSI